MEQIELIVDKREILGKKVKSLRRQGVTPIHLFGPSIKSLPLQCETAKLQRVLTKAGQTKLIRLKLDDERGHRAVITREVQRAPLTGEPLHVDFYQVKMAEKVRVEVPITLVGEAPALKLKENILGHELFTLVVECLPAKIPTYIELNLSSLAEPQQSIRVKDIKLDEDITLLNDPEVVVVKISSRPVERLEEKAIEEAAEEIVTTPETPSQAEKETGEV